MKRATAWASVLLAALILQASAWAKAPKSAETWRPVDTSPGSLTDPGKLLQIDLDGRVYDITLTELPARLVYDQVAVSLGVQFGYDAGVDFETSFRFESRGTARELLTALGKLTGVRFEAAGPTQLRVFQARKGPVRKAPSEVPGTPRPRKP